jgi:hypothetical protein
LKRWILVLRDEGRACWRTQVTCLGTHASSGVCIQAGTSVSGWRVWWSVKKLTAVLKPAIRTALWKANRLKVLERLNQRRGDDAEGGELASNRLKSEGVRTT